MRKYAAFTALILAASFWGLNVAVTKFTLDYIPPFTFAVIRFGTAALILLPFITKKLKIELKDIPLIVITGLFGVSLHITALFFGVRETTALNAGLIIGAAPIFTFLLAHIFLKEKLNKNILVAAVLGTIGIIIVTTKDYFISGGLQVSFYGDMLMVLSMITFVAYEIISKKLFKKYKPLTITFYSFLIGTITFIPFAITETLNTGTSYLLRLPIQASLGILFGIFISSLAAYTLWEWGLSKVQTSRVGFFLYLDPLAATLGGVFILNEVITPLFLVGGGFIAAGILLSQIHRKQIHTHRARHK